MSTPLIQNKLLRLTLTEGVFFLPLQDIIRLEARSNYTWIYCRHRRPLLAAMVLKQFEAGLLPFGLLRTHRWHLVNRQHIAGILRQDSVKMAFGDIISISKRKRAAVVQALSRPLPAA